MIKRNLTTVLTFLTLCSLAGATDLNATLTDQQAQAYTLNLGPGSLATITLPETAKTVIVTRSGIVETSTASNRVIIAGVSTTGTTPLQIATENHVWTWRVNMSPTNESSIVNVTIIPNVPSPAVQSPPTPAALGLIGTPSQTTVVAPTSSSPNGPLQAVTTLAVQIPVPQIAAARTSAIQGPPMPLTINDLPSITLSMTRDGQDALIQYKAKAGSHGLMIDERALKLQSRTGAANTRANLATLTLSPNEVRYGTILVSNITAGKASIVWPYQVGLNKQTLSQNVMVP